MQKRPLSSRCLPWPSPRPRRQAPIEQDLELVDKLPVPARTAGPHVLSDILNKFAVARGAQVRFPIPGRVNDRAPVLQDRVACSQGVPPRARPGIIRRVRDKATPHGVRFVVAYGLEGVAVVENGRIEPALPEVAVAVFLVVKILRIAHVESVQGFGQGIGIPGDTDILDMVAHQAVSPDRESEFGQAFAEHVEVAAVVGVLLEDRLAVVAALEDMVRISGSNGAGNSAHRSRLSSGLRGSSPWGAWGARLDSGGRQATAGGERKAPDYNCQ